MCQEDTQVEFEFGSGRIIFGRIMPQLDLEKFQKCVTRINRSSSDVVLFKLFSAMFNMHLALMYLGVRQFITSPIF